MPSPWYSGNIREIITRGLGFTNTDSGIRWIPTHGFSSDTGPSPASLTATCNSVGSFDVDWGSPIPLARAYILELWNVTDGVLIRRTGTNGPCGVTSCCGGFVDGETTQSFFGEAHQVPDNKACMVKMWFYGDGTLDSQARCAVGEFLVYAESNTFTCHGGDPIEETVITSIGSNADIDTQTPDTCYEVGDSSYNVTFVTDPTGVSVGDKVTLAGEMWYAYYRVTNILQVTDGPDVYTLIYVSDTLPTGGTSPCSVLYPEDTSAVPWEWVQSPAHFSRFYTTITEWESSLDDTDVYSSGDKAIGECHNDSVFVEGEINITGGGTVGLASIELTAHIDSRHDGTKGSGVVVQNTGTSYQILLSVDNITLSWLEIDGTDDKPKALAVQADDIYIQNNLIYDFASGDAALVGIYIAPAASGPYITNNFLWNFTYTGSGLAAIFHSTSTSAGIKCYNNTIYHVDFSGDGANYIFWNTLGSSTTEVRNLILMDWANANLNNGSVHASAVLDYWGLEALEADVDNETIETVADTFVDSTVSDPDLHLKSTSALSAGTGVDLGIDPDYVEFDIDGLNRNLSGDPWDIGADQTAYTPVTGCMDPTANNYNPLATVSDGSCTYTHGCMDPLAENYNPLATVSDGSCTYITGCMDPTANNYNPLATVSDGSCTYTHGCMDPEANNYNAAATVSDGSCTYDPPDVPGCMDPAANNYNPLATVSDGSCSYDPADVPGCMDPVAENYNPLATVSDGSCTYIPGCMDPAAENYNASATISDGSCTYIHGCMDPTASNYNASATVSDGSCTYIHGCMDPLAENYNPLATVSDGSCTYITGCMDPTASNYNPLATVSDGSCTYITGCMDPTADNYNALATISDGSCVWEPVDPVIGGVVGIGQYPFICPSDSLSFLISDVYLNYTDFDREHGKHLKIDWLCGFGLGHAISTPPSGACATHPYDLQISDKSGAVVFNSVSAIRFSAFPWGSDRKILEWINADDEILRVVITTAWPDNIIVNGWPSYFEPTSAKLDPRTYQAIPSRIRTISVVTDRDDPSKDITLPQGADVIFRGGYNVDISPGTVYGVDGKQLVQPLTISAEPGSGIGKFPCEPDSFLRRINDAGADGNGNFLVDAADCYRFERPLDTVADIDLDLPFRSVAVSPGTMTLSNDCGPCCDCQDFINVYEAIRKVSDKYLELGARAEAVRDQYKLNRQRWLANKQCRKGGNLQLVMQDLSMCRVAVVGALCNTTDLPFRNVELRFCFTYGPDSEGFSADTTIAGCILCNTTTKQGDSSHRTRPYKLGGSWPRYSAYFDCIMPGENGVINFVMYFPFCTNDDRVEACLRAFGEDTGGATIVCSSVSLNAGSEDVCCDDTDPLGQTGDTDPLCGTDIDNTNS